MENRPNKYYSFVMGFVGGYGSNYLFSLLNQDTANKIVNKNFSDDLLLSAVAGGLASITLKAIKNYKLEDVIEKLFIPATIGILTGFNIYNVITKLT